MKLHLPSTLFRTLIACVALAGSSFADSVTYTFHQDGPLNISEQSDVVFENIQYTGSGAAIYQGEGAASDLSLNDSVSFKGNTEASQNASDSWENIEGGGAICNRGDFSFLGNGAVTFSENTASPYYYDEATGGAVNNSGTFTLSENGNVTFSRNSVSSSYYFYGFGGAIGNSFTGTFTLSNNGDVKFSENTADYNGGAIWNGGTFTLSGNDDVTFSENTADYNGGAIGNIGGTFTLSGNRKVTFSENMASFGGAIHSEGTFTMSGNGDVTFCGNWAGSPDYITSGGAICILESTFTLSGNGNVTFSGNIDTFGGAIGINGSSTFTLSGNGDVLFEKNAAISSDFYRLRSIYSYHPYSTLNLSTSEGKRILFKDSVYASGTVNLNQGGTGDIIFTGISTESDLREVKGGVNGTKVEILGSQISQFLADVTLGGGSLQVQDGAKLTFGGLSVGTASQSAALQLQNGWVDVSMPLTLADGSSLSLSGCNFLLSSGITAQGNNTLDIQLGDAQQQTPALTTVGALSNAGNVVLHLGDLSGLQGENYHILHVLGDSAGWSDAELQFTGAASRELTWVGGDLYYRYDASLLPSQTRTDKTVSQRLSVEAFEILTQNKALVFEGSSSGITNSENYAVIFDNENVTFSGNTASASPSYYYYYNETTGGAITNVRGTFTLSGNGDVTFSGNSSSALASYDYYYTGGAITNVRGTFTLSGNGDVTFSGNTASHYDYAGGAITNVEGTFTLSGNGDVTFSGNSASAPVSYYYNYTGGAIVNDRGTFTLSGNGDVTFSGNTASSYYTSSDNRSSGAITNVSGTFTLSGNGDVTFSGNTASSVSSAGAIYNSYDSTFMLSGNGDVTFSGNTAFSSGGAIVNRGTFTLSGNGDVLFEKNAENPSDSYRLRSIYSVGTLNLSASEGKSILFKDSVYASGTVNLNQGGTGDIIFTGATTEADLREMKGGVDGTAEQILYSRTSGIATNAKLYGGRLIVEDGAILTGRGITITKGADATIRLKDATLDETGYAIAVSAGSGLEFEGENMLNAASVQMADGAFLSFVMGEGSGTNWDAQLITGQLNVQVSGDLLNEHRLLTLSNASQYDTTRWTSDVVTVSGASFESLRWHDGVLTYVPLNFPNVITPDADGLLDDLLPDDGNTIINGNGHTLTVKNEVQLVQMALKDGIVKLEGENNGIVSVTLTEGGELVLTAGAGLKTGDIISMVASGKGELVISGDITLDNKGMKGKAGALATVSHADAQVLGDATISNVRVENSVIDLAEGSTVGFEHVVLAATTRITDDPATAKLDDVTAELVMGVNTSLTGSDLLLAGTTLAQSGNTGVTLTLSDDASVLMLEATTFDSLTLSGSTLVLELAGMTLEMFDNAELIAVSFTSGTSYATFDKSLAVTLSVDGINYERGYTMESDDTPTTMYFRGGKKPAPATPEPATGTLSLLALAALAARRRRK